MAFSASADSNRAQVRYVVEAQPGVTPATPQMKNLRITAESLNTNRSTQQSNEIRSDRNVSDLVTTGESSSGDLSIELSFEEYDDLLEGALQGLWGATDSNVLRNGVTRKSFTIEKEFADVGKFERFTGCEVTTFSLTMAAQAYITGSFGIMARGNASATTALDATPTPSKTNPVFNSTYNMSGLTINGVAYGDGIKNFTFSLNNNPREQYQIASKDLAGIGMGNAQITGSLNAYFGNATAILEAYKNDVPVKLEFTLTSLGNSYTITLPAVKFSSKKHVAGGINQDVELDMGFQAILDPVTGCSIQILRTYA